MHLTNHTCDLKVQIEPQLWLGFGLTISTPLITWLCGVELIMSPIVLNLARPISTRNQIGLLTPFLKVSTSWFAQLDLMNLLGLSSSLWTRLPFLLVDAVTFANLRDRFSFLSTQLILPWETPLISSRCYGRREKLLWRWESVAQLVGGHCCSHELADWAMLLLKKVLLTLWSMLKISIFWVHGTQRTSVYLPCCFQNSDGDLCLWFPAQSSLWTFKVESKFFLVGASFCHGAASITWF